MKSVGVGVLAALWLAATAAGAEPRDPAGAQALFDEARGLERAQRYDEACAKLAESQRLDPGIGTQFHLADCYEHQGKVASAWAVFLEVASLARASGQTDREKVAMQRAARLEPRLPKLEIDVPASSRIAELTVSRDGVAIGPAMWDSAVPVDPGEHAITATAPGRRSFTQSVHAEEGRMLPVTIPLLEPERGAPAPKPAPKPEPRPEPRAQSAARAAPASVERASESSQAHRNPWLIGLGAAGVVGLGAGTVLGVLARSKYDHSKDYCAANDENRCNAHGVELRDDAFTLAHASTAAFIFGGAALGAAGVLWLTTSGPPPQRGRANPTLNAGIAAGTIWASGRF